MKKINFKQVNNSNGRSEFIYGRQVEKPKPKVKVKDKPIEVVYKPVELKEPFREFHSTINTIRETPTTVEKNEFKVGDIVEIVDNQAHSCNYIGDIGKIVEISNYSWAGKRYRVETEGRTYGSHAGNWSNFEDLIIAGSDPIEPPTDEEFLKSLKVSYNGSCGFTIKMLNRRKKEIIYKAPSNFNTSAISCGINTYCGINSIFEMAVLKDYFLSCGFKHLFDEDLFMNLIRQGIKSIFENKKIGMLLISTNIDKNKDFNNICSVLENFEHVTWKDTYNSNSRNNIRLWICDLHKYQNDL